MLHYVMLCYIVLYYIILLYIYYIILYYIYYIYILYIYYIYYIIYIIYIIYYIIYIYVLVMYPMNYVHVVVGFITPLRTRVNPCDCWRRPAMRTYSSSTFSDTVDSLRYLACLGRMALEIVEERIQNVLKIILFL